MKSSKQLITQITQVIFNKTQTHEYGKGTCRRRGEGGARKTREDRKQEYSKLFLDLYGNVKKSLNKNHKNIINYFISLHDSIKHVC